MVSLTRKSSKKIDPFKQSSKILFHHFEQVDFDMFGVTRVVFFISILMDHMLFKFLPMCQ
jgi:hypothetical protein